MYLAIGHTSLKIISLTHSLGKKTLHKTSSPTFSNKLNIALVLHDVVLSCSSFEALYRSLYHPIGILRETTKKCEDS